jgi:hypothetical protein
MSEAEDSRAGLRGVFVKLDPHAMGIANVAEAFEEIAKLTPEVRMPFCTI